MSAPENCRFLESHEWHRLDGSVVTIGITKFAIDELTDVTYVELPSVGDEVKAGDAVGEIESVKATSDLYVGVDGKVVEVNQDAIDDPSVINHDPHDAGWLLKVEVADASALDGMMDAAGYEAKYPSA